MDLATYTWLQVRGMTCNRAIHPPTALAGLAGVQLQFRQFHSQSTYTPTNQFRQLRGVVPGLVEALN